ncbi:MAG: hypothetical protein LQ337_002156 [Flavoplaca oasis]|nr:MAG: hypothetical protein LQ337_002156 [Flavoplaca oasis]
MLVDRSSAINWIRGSSNTGSSKEPLVSEYDSEWMPDEVDVTGREPDPDINASFWAAEVLTVVVTIGYWLSCREKVPICDRRRYNSSLFPGKHIEQGLRAERRLAEAAKEGQDEASRVILPDSHPFVQAVLSVVPRLSAAAETDPVNWDIEVVDALTSKIHAQSKAGKIVVDSGLSAITSTEDELAAVLSHAFSHEIAGHLSEYSSKHDLCAFTILSAPVLLMPAVLSRLGLAWIRSPPISLVVLSTSAMVATFGDLVGLSSFWCKEADQIAILMMMEAGYNPGAIGTVAAKLKRSEVAGTTICPYDAENRETLYENNGIARCQDAAEFVRNSWGSSDDDVKAMMARKSRWDGYLKTRRQEKASKSHEGHTPEI